MAVRRKPLSARTLATLRAKAKKSKLFNLADLKHHYRRGQGAFLSAGVDQEYQCQHGQWLRVNKLIKW